MRERISVVWLKRDIRLHDHAPLAFAIESDFPILLLYIFEPSLLSHYDANTRHFRFVYESIADIDKKIKPEKILISQLEALDTFDVLNEYYEIKNILSHQEVGVKLTFDRDRSIKKWAIQKGISYREFHQNGTIRGKQHRVGWQEQLDSRYFEAPEIDICLEKSKLAPVSEIIFQKLNPDRLPQEIITPNLAFQPGGESYALRYLDSFLQNRIHNYSKTLSKPAESRTGCSRLSPYLAFGCISAKKVIQTSHLERYKLASGWDIKNFSSRIWWRSHYIQKLETDWRIEIQPINPVFEMLERNQESELLEAWKSGQTGFPMVDAAMRCLHHTGWINFRMRAMLVTFASFGLWLDFRPLARHLAKLFLDYDPGIHYPQIQMQAGLTGYHTLRIFNPNQQVSDHDPKGLFIKKWVPELENVPPAMLSKPWEMSYMEQKFYRCVIGSDYPAPVIDYGSSLRRNRERYWQIRQSPEAQRLLPQIWRKFCIPPDIQKYQVQQDVCRFEPQDE